MHGVGRRHAGLIDATALVQSMQGLMALVVLENFQDSCRHCVHVG